ncbi:MAG: hypothetical protein ABJO52_20910 [Nisaea sp.]|uniref:hypothetical protein n=1 Tax=Nisaea sp. TaxID=2024842 RepID=UPI0032984FF4
MADYLGEFNKGSGAADESRRQRDFDDLQLELSGADVGWISRFLSPEVRNAIRDGRNGQGGSGSKLSALDYLLLNDPKYARIYEAAVDENRVVRMKHSAFEQRLEKAVAKAEKEVEDSISNAVTLPDGRKAFLDKDGVAWTLENERVDDAIREGIDWDGREPRESHIDKVERLNSLQNLQPQSAALGMRLGEISDALHDDDAPPTKDEIKAYREEQEAITVQIEGLDEKLDSTLAPAKPLNDMANDIEAVKVANVVPEI